jgi:Bacterial toxin 33
MGGGAGLSGTGQTIVISVPSGNGNTSDDPGSYSISTPGSIDDPTVPDNTSDPIDPIDPIASDTPTANSDPSSDGNSSNSTTGGGAGSSGTGQAIVVSVPSGSPDSPVGVSNAGTTIGGSGTSINPAAIPPNLFISDSNSSRSNQQNMGDDDSEDSDSEDDTSPEETRQRILTFLEAQRLAGERWTAKGIAEKLDIPIEIARIAVLHPIGRNVKVEIPDVSGLYEGEKYAQLTGDFSSGNYIDCGILTGLCKVVVGGIVIGVVATVNAAIDLWNHFFPARTKDVPSDNPEERDWKQDKPLTDGEAERLGDPEQLKKDILGSNANIGKYDLYKDKKGNIYVKPKGNKGPGAPTGLNIKDFF